MKFTSGASSFLYRGCNRCTGKTRFTLSFAFFISILKSLTSKSIEFLEIFNNIAMEDGSRGRWRADASIEYPTFREKQATRDALGTETSTRGYGNVENARISNASYGEIEKLRLSSGRRFRENRKGIFFRFLPFNRTDSRLAR